MSDLGRRYVVLLGARLRSPRCGASDDAQDIRRRTAARTRVVYVTHYFGWAQDLARPVIRLEDEGRPVEDDGRFTSFSPRSARGRTS